MSEPNFWSKLLLQPFFIGLYIGLFISIVIYVKSLFDKRKLKRELNELRKHLHTKLEIDSEANEKTREDFEFFKTANENLRITVQALSQKPGRRELKQLHLYQKAIDLMMQRVPGFAPAWQNALKEGELEIQKTEKGFIPFLRRLITPASFREIEEDK